MLYLRVDKTLSWKEVILQYVQQFPSESGRSKPGLQGSLYRKDQQIPVLDERRNLTFTEDGHLTLAFRLAVSTQAHMAAKQTDIMSHSGQHNCRKYVSCFALRAWSWKGCNWGIPNNSCSET